MTARLLVTGSKGLLGRAIVERLQRGGHDVLGLDPLVEMDQDAGQVRDDLTNTERVKALLSSERITHVIHGGGVSGPMVMADQPDRVIAINVGGTLNLLTAALQCGVKTFVFCSSISAVGDFYEQKPIGDDYPLRPGTAYGCSKAAVDMMLRGLFGRVPLDLCSLRFTGIYGPGRSTAFVVDEIVAAAVEGRAARVEPSTDWPYIYVDDAADATIAACLSERRRQLVYYIAYPEQVSLAALAAAAGNPALEIDASLPVLRRGPVDVEPARRDFGFNPAIDHREGIGRMLAARRAGV